ncbi:DUF6660 family protein [Botryobacter ruber]|uniref:DUF6660 family protein n=1 Tax=Botryobacter ruber TaxID=2171629 RepID=UPI000FEC5F48|nr:DUF6660 family protein [Botryobacter ruber]
MRYLTVIWAMFIFLLACIPCTDSAMAAALDNDTVAAAAHNPESPAHADDLCSPLCECKCCGGTVLLIVTQTVAEPQLVHRNPDNSLYLSFDIASPSFPYWHPPRA